MALFKIEYYGFREVTVVHENLNEAMMITYGKIYKFQQKKLEKFSKSKNANFKSMSNKDYKISRQDG